MTFFVDRLRLLIKEIDPADKLGFYTRENFRLLQNYIDLMVDTLIAELTSLEERVGLLELEVASINIALDVITSDLKKIKDQLKTIQKNIKDIQSDVKSLQKDVKKLQDQMIQVQKDIELLTDNINSLRRDVKKYVRTEIIEHVTAYELQLVFVLTKMPSEPESVKMLVNGVTMLYGWHYVVAGQTVTWNPIAAGFHFQILNDSDAEDHVTFYYNINPNWER